MYLTRFKEPPIHLRELRDLSVRLVFDSLLTGMIAGYTNVKRYLINYPYLSDYGQTIFCLSFPSRDRATAPGRCE